MGRYPVHCARMCRRLRGDARVFGTASGGPYYRQEIRVHPAARDTQKGRSARVAFTPEKVGTFAFHCDNFCGNGHPNMTGEIVVVE